MPLRRTTLTHYQDRLLKAQLHLEAHLDDRVTPADLARVAGFSLHHFHRVFRAQLGETVMERIRRLRLERAARRLRANDARLLEVALDAGYDSHEAFTRAFVERFGVPPSTWREQPSARVDVWVSTHAAEPVRPVTIERHAPVRVGFLRSTGSYAAVGAVWARLIEWVQRHAELKPPPKLYGLCPDDPEVTDEAQLRFDACVALGEHDAPGLEIGEVPGGTWAVAVHTGPYERLWETYVELIGRWAPTSGFELAPEAVVEHYLNDPSTAAPHELRTEVRVRLAEG